MPTVLAVVKAVKTGEDSMGNPTSEPCLPALLRLDVPLELAIPGQLAWATVLVEVKGVLPG